jgi:ATP-dependent exoDNAse (exonuclease V) alpha subunit
MERSRRATAQWMRDVAGDLRAGRTAAALGQLRKHGAVAEYRSHEQAKAALITAWQQAKSEGQSALLIAGRRSSVHDLNLLAREALASELGRARSYGTSYGERSFAIGDRLVAREPDRLSQTVNGDLLRVVSHRKDGLLECQRVRDEKMVLWDTHEHPSLDYGYATTSYRAQGQTVDRVLVLAEQADDRRGVYVGVTRAREQVAIAYGKDEMEWPTALRHQPCTEMASRKVSHAEQSFAVY